MKIGISFSDNDYQRDVRAFLSLLPQLNYGTTYSKVDLVKTFNIVAPELSDLGYLSRNGALDPRDTTHSYFQITVDDIYFDDEIIEYLESYCKEDNYYWDNYEFHYIDLTTGDIISV